MPSNCSNITWKIFKESHAFHKEWGFKKTAYQKATDEWRRSVVSFAFPLSFAFCQKNMLSSDLLLSCFLTSEPLGVDIWVKYFLVIKENLAFLCFLWIRSTELTFGTELRLVVERLSVPGLHLFPIYFFNPLKHSGPESYSVDLQKAILPLTLPSSMTRG